MVFLWFNYQRTHAEHGWKHVTELRELAWDLHDPREVLGLAVVLPGKYELVSWYYCCQLNGKIKHVPNHQPVLVPLGISTLSSHITYSNWEKHWFAASDSIRLMSDSCSLFTKRRGEAQISASPHMGQKGKTCGTNGRKSSSTMLMFNHNHNDIFNSKQLFMNVV